MKTITLTINHIGGSKLSFVKFIKDHSGMGLKESKEWCDIAMTELGKKQYLTIKTSLAELKKDSQSIGFDISFEDKEKQRHLKLIGLGLGDDMDKIEIIAEELGNKLSVQVRQRQFEHIAVVAEDFFKDFLLTLNSQQIEELINKHIEENTNGERLDTL